MRLFRLPASVVASCQATMLMSPAITGEEVPIGRHGEEEGPRQGFRRKGIVMRKDGGSLPAYFVKVDNSRRPRPTILQTNGYDSTIQEMYFAHAPAAIRRGYNFLCFDGPGQGRNLIRDGIPIRPDWENVVRPVVDFALKRHEIDPKRLVLIGWSFGGYLAPRAASGEHRIAALVADPGEWDQRDLWVAALPISEEEQERYPDLSPETLRSLGVAARSGREPLLELGAPPARAVGARGRHLTRLLRLHDGLRAIDGGRPDLLSHAPHPRGGRLYRVVRPEALRDPRGAREEARALHRGGGGRRSHRGLGTSTLPPARVRLARRGVKAAARTKEAVGEKR